jgi:hypothetical protein
VNQAQSKHLLSIGEFARQSRLSHKALQELSALLGKYIGKTGNHTYLTGLFMVELPGP